MEINVQKQEEQQSLLFIFERSCRPCECIWRHLLPRRVYYCSHCRPKMLLLMDKYSVEWHQELILLFQWSMSSSWHHHQLKWATGINRNMQMCWQSHDFLDKFSFIAHIMGQSREWITSDTLRAEVKVTDFLHDYTYYYTYLLHLSLSWH